MKGFGWMRKIYAGLNGARAKSPAESPRSTPPRLDVAAEQHPGSSAFGFAPKRALDEVAATVFPETGPAADETTDIVFARECGLDAVFRWYVWFLETGTEDHPPPPGEQLPERDRPIGAASRRQGHGPIPGFPGASYQVVETQEHGLRVRFYDLHGRALGALGLNPQGDSCTIDVEGGQSYLVREVSEVDALHSSQQPV